MASKSDLIFRYRIRHWPEYNRALVRRGSLIFGVDAQVVRGWRDAGDTGPRCGRPRLHANTAIESALVVKAVFHLSLRATQGFLESVVRLIGVDLPVPASSTVCRRQAGLDLRPESPPARQPRYVVADSIGLKVKEAGG